MSRCSASVLLPQSLVILVSLQSMVSMSCTQIRRPVLPSPLTLLAFETTLFLSVARLRGFDQQAGWCRYTSCSAPAKSPQVGPRCGSSQSCLLWAYLLTLASSPGRVAGRWSMTRSSKRRSRRFQARRLPRGDPVEPPSGLDVVTITNDNTGRVYRCINQIVC